MIVIFNMWLCRNMSNQGSIDKVRSEFCKLQNSDLTCADPSAPNMTEPIILYIFLSYNLLIHLHLDKFNLLKFLLISLFLSSTQLTAIPY